MIKVREGKETVEQNSQNESPGEFNIELNRLGTLDENTHIGYKDEMQDGSEM